MSKPTPRIAFFVTPHGFGHASRAAAVAESLTRRLPSCKFEFFTTVPKHHIAASVENFDYHPLSCDIGMVQTDALTEDLSQTIQRLNSFLPFDLTEVRRLATYLKRQHCIAVISDISPLGLKVAYDANLPSVLIENFTWDWIYRSYAQNHPQIDKHEAYLSSIFSGVDLHIQCQPICQIKPDSVLTSPISRMFQMEPATVRSQLGISPTAKMVYISMGGTPHPPPDLQILAKHSRDIYFVISGHYPTRPIHSNIRILPIDSPLFHVDLVRSANVVIGKAGYSTIAEVYQAGVPFGYFSRLGNPEMGPLLSFLEKHIQGIHFRDNDYQTNAWLERLEELLSIPRVDRSEEPNGAEQCADVIGQLVGSEFAITR